MGANVSAQMMGKTLDGAIRPIRVDEDGNMLAAVSVDVTLTPETGIIASANFTPTNTAYGAGDIMDVAKEFAWTYAKSGLAIPDNSLIRIISAIIKIDATGLQASEGVYSLQTYSVTPPSAKADNAAWALESADLPSYRGAVNLGTPVDLGNALFNKMNGVDTDLKLTTASMYGQLTTISAFTPTAVARQIILYGTLV